ncbi:hypothetical protein BJF78_35215 [Pseudonocardia sp. CNS-139]|nr:hypothetical protein BJF78_35215 [Pseudonocardia sp. CNS-139]
MNRSATSESGAGDAVTRKLMGPAVVRPDHRGRTHPDPRADPPTQAFDPANAPTVRLPPVVADTVRIPTVHNAGRIAATDTPPADTGLHDGSRSPSAR